MVSCGFEMSENQLSVNSIGLQDFKQNHFLRANHVQMDFMFAP